MSLACPCHVGAHAAPEAVIAHAASSSSTTQDTGDANWETCHVTFDTKPHVIRVPLTVLSFVLKIFKARKSTLSGQMQG